MSRLPDYIKKKSTYFPELWPFETLGILNLTAIYLKNYLIQGLETWSADGMMSRLPD